MSWRNTLFVWRGTVEGGREWRGTWVGTDGLDEPDEEEFAGDGAMSFSAKREGDQGDGVEGSWSSRYDLDDGGGNVASHEDPPYRLIRIEGRAHVVGKGENEFGHYLVHGNLENDVLTLCRRYLDDSDGRVKMTIEALAQLPRDEALAIKWRKKKQKK